MTLTYEDVVGEARADGRTLVSVERDGARGGHARGPRAVESTGVGLALALACDVLLPSERARIVPAFGRIGLVPEVGSSWLEAQRAFELGIGNELVAHERLLEAAAAGARRSSGCRVT